jgi:hypothetical protein
MDQQQLENSWECSDLSRPSFYDLPSDISELNEF